MSKKNEVAIKNCPICRAIMRISYTPKRKKYFWLCTAFPKCKHTEKKL